MTTSPYSFDLRKKVINYIEKGKSQASASEAFGLHKNTVNRWCKRYKEVGVFTAKPRLGFKSKVNKLELEEFIKNNPNIKLSEAGIKFGITGSQVGNILKKLGFSYKKKPLPTWKLAKTSENNTNK